MRSVLLRMVFIGVLIGAPLLGAPTLRREDAEGRLRMALQIAREKNDRALVAAVDELGREFKQGQPADAEGRLRDLEAKVGIDPGGWSMAGQRIFRPTPALVARSKELGGRLAAAMQADDAAQVRDVVAAMGEILGDQAGVPDGRRAGRKVAPRPMTEAAATRLWLDALQSEAARLRPLREAKPMPDQMVRLYAYLLNATTGMIPLVAKHAPAELAEVERLARGLGTILVGLQQPAGFFPFPDLRGKNIRFGSMTEQQLGAGRIEVRDGWIVSADPDGGSQFDTGLAGVALLAAGRLQRNEVWKRAGLRAADWALGQPCCSNFNYNAFSISLLAKAYEVTGEAKYLDGAWRKFRVGVAPGQAANGRWIDPHNARTVYHVILLRALGDLHGTLPADRAADRKEVAEVAGSALRALLDEFDAMGVTVEALPELLTLQAVFPEDPRLRAAVAVMATSLVAKCTDGKRVRMGAQPDQLAAVVRAGR